MPQATKAESEIRKPSTSIGHLYCVRCSRTYYLDPYLYCPACGGALEYSVPSSAQPAARPLGAIGHFRYADFFPMPESVRSQPISLGEGGTPLQECLRIGGLLGLRKLLVKNEGLNPTASWKDRPISLAVNCAKGFGSKCVVVYSCGNAGSSAAAYAARVGIRCVVFALPTIKSSMVDLIQVHGGVVVPLDITPKELWVDGRVGELLENTQKELGWFPITTVRYPYVGSPYYTEGYKSIAYELLEELGEVPDWVLVPVGSGEGLYGIWKGFVELRDLGRIAKTPKMAGVQARGAAPLVTAYEKGLGDPPPIKKARTVASGIEVMVSSRCALRAVKESGGCAIAVSDQEIVEAAKLLATREGLYVSPEGAAAVAGLKVLKATHRLRSSDCVVCITTASGIKYVKQAALHGKLALRCVPPELENIQRYVEQHFKRDW